jgi:hypothetical protein
MSERDWTPTRDRLPQEHVVVETMTESGAVNTLKRVGRLWFLPDGSMYVYYTPVLWRHFK